MSQENSPQRGIRPAADKLRLVLEASKLDDHELGEFLRREGIHRADLEEWQGAMLSGLEPSRRESLAKRQKKALAQDESLRRITALERDLDRKNKALAEMTALFTLKKRVEEIWEDEADTTPESNES